MHHDDRLRIRLLGELQLVRGDGRPVALPASRKTRALLGYLVATARPHRRERLCDLLWDGPDDPRGELRWSLSKIRPLLNHADTIRLATDRERVGFEERDTDVDLATVRRLLGSGSAGLASASVEDLKTAIALLHGEFLDGLDLPACYRYQEWCLAEREAVSARRLAALSALTEKLTEQPEEALRYARALVAADPLSEAGHAAVVRILGNLGRRREALRHYDHAQGVLHAELGARPSGALEAARRALPAATLQPASRTPPRRAAPETNGGNSSTSRSRAASVTPIVGRHAERALLEQLATATADRRGSRVALVTGEPGIGKTHLLDRLKDCIVFVGGHACGARAFEAEMSRPYGIWIDVLRTITRGRSSERLRDLAPLLPELGPAPTEALDRSRLFDGVVGLLEELAVDAPIVITLDDVQWIDEASSSLLHYVARKLDVRSGILLACAARSGELEDNAAASSVLRSLSGEDRLQEISLAPLSAAETAELTRAVDPSLDSARIFAESEGNPLFILELARAQGRHDGGRKPTARTVDGVIAGQLARLKAPSREVLAWAAAFGRSFTADALMRVGAFDLSELLAALEELERRGIVQPDTAGAYDFVHDLVRRTAYQGVSQPRRKLLHRQIARSLSTVVETDDSVAGDLAHHAAFAEDHETAARACLIAGERCLRLFANAEANGLAQRGLGHLDRLPSSPFTAEARIGLLRVRILAAASPGMRPLPPLDGEVAQAVAAAEASGMHQAAATGHYLLSVLHQAAGESERAQESSLRAAEAGRTADHATRARQLANTGRCLVELDTEIARARTLLRESESIADPLGLDICELHWGRGLLERWDGEYDEAGRSIERALALARGAEDRWREYKCLTLLAMIALERGQCAAALARCAQLMQVARKLGEEDVPFVLTLEALARCAGEEGTPGVDDLGRPFDQLRAVDDKSYLAYASNIAAMLHLDRDEPTRARAWATEALAAAGSMQRRSEMAIARAILARTRVEWDEPGAAAEIESLVRTFPQESIGARAHAIVLDASSWIDTQPRRHSSTGVKGFEATHEIRPRS